MKGLIICGYPGIGKSSIAGWNNCIDLESSYFSYRDRMPQGTEHWVPQYCELACDLAEQGFTVMVSSHESVRYTLHKLLRKHDIPVVIFVPRPEMKEGWTCRLAKRYLKTNKEKDLRAFEDGIKYWETNMEYMNKQKFPIYSPDSIDYDLREEILKIRKKEGLDVDEPDTKDSV